MFSFVAVMSPPTFTADGAVAVTSLAKLTVSPAPPSVSVPLFANVAGIDAFVNCVDGPRRETSYVAATVVNPLKATLPVTVTAPV